MSRGGELFLLHPFTVPPYCPRSRCTSRMPRPRAITRARVNCSFVSVGTESTLVALLPGPREGTIPPHYATNCRCYRVHPYLATLLPCWSNVCQHAGRKAPPSNETTLGSAASPIAKTADFHGDFGPERRLRSAQKSFHLCSVGPANALRTETDVVGRPATPPEQVIASILDRRSPGTREVVEGLMETCGTVGRPCHNGCCQCRLCRSFDNGYTFSIQSCRSPSRTGVAGLAA